LEDFKRAEKILIEDLAREDSAELYYLYGLLNSKRNEDIKALQYFDSTIFIDSLHYKAYIEKASLYAKNKRYSVALKLLDSAELIYPEFDGIYVNRGKVYAEMNQPYLMLKQFEKAIKIDSTNSVTLSNFGTYYLKSADFN
jgi:tetratricopeptide (TPR) repeat protein